MDNELLQIINEAEKNKLKYKDFNVNRIEMIANNNTERITSYIISELIKRYNHIINNAILRKELVVNDIINEEYRFFYPNYNYVSLIDDDYELELFKSSIIYNVINMRKKMLILDYEHVGIDRLLNNLKNNHKVYVFANELIANLSRYNINTTIIPNLSSKDGIINVKSFIYRIDEIIEKNNTLTMKIDK